MNIRRCLLVFVCAASTWGRRTQKKVAGETLNQYDSLRSLLFALHPSMSDFSRHAVHQSGYDRRPFAHHDPLMSVDDGSSIDGDPSQNAASGTPSAEPIESTINSTEASTEELGSDVFRRIAYARRTARDYDQTKAIPNDVLADILATAQRAPTGFNLQPYKVIVVRDKTQREKLSQAFVGDGNVRRVRNAPVTVIFLADLEPARLIPKTMELGRKEGLPEQFLTGTLAPGVLGLTVPGRFGIPTPLNLATTAASLLTPLPVLSDVEAWSFKNAMLVASQMMLAATSYGVSSSPMEGFDARRIFQVLKMPFTEIPRYSIPLAISMGYDIDPPKSSPSLRFPPEDVFFLDEFGNRYNGIEPMQ